MVHGASNHSQGNADRLCRLAQDQFPAERFGPFDRYFTRIKVWIKGDSTQPVEFLDRSKKGKKKKKKKKKKSTTGHIPVVPNQNSHQSSQMVPSCRWPSVIPQSPRAHSALSLCQFSKISVAQIYLPWPAPFCPGDRHDDCSTSVGQEDIWRGTPISVSSSFTRLLQKPLAV